jgi:hypothetical protein
MEQDSDVIPFDAVKQREMDRLLDMNREGTISPDERSILAALVAEAENLTVANAQRILDARQRRERST